MYIFHHPMQLVNRPFILACLVLGVFAVISALMRLLSGAPKTSVSQAYEAVPALLTPAERSFFGALQRSVGSSYQIFAKVRLADVVRPVRSPSRSGWQSAFNRISSKHVDFVLCDLERLDVVAVIELDDRTHARFEREFRDSLVDSAVADAGIPILHVPARQTYSPLELRERLQGLLHTHKKVKDQNA